MKNFSILGVALLFSVSALAQTKSQTNLFSNFKPMKLEKGLALSKTSSALKTLAQGLYYTKPEGSMYTVSSNGSDGDNNAWYSYQSSILTVPGFSTQKFVNKSTKPSSTSWTVNGQQIDENNLDGNDFVASVAPYRSYYMPKLTNGSNTFFIGEKADNPTNASFLTDSVTVKSFYDWASGFWGVNGTTGNWQYSYGSTTDEKFGKCVHIETTYPKPASTLWVSEVVFPVISNSGKFIPANDSLTFTFTDVKESTGSDGSTILRAGDKVLYTIKVGAGDVIKKETQAVAGINSTIASLIVAKKEKDVFGIESNVPMMFNDRFALIITGVDQDGMDIGFAGCIPTDYDGLDSPYMTRFAYANSEGLYAWTNNPPISLATGFNGMMDACEVATDKEFTVDYSVVRISDDGQTCSSENGTDDQKIPGVLVGTTITWFVDENTTNYALEWEGDEAPSWITGISVDDQSLRYSENTPGYNMISFTAEPLPDGVKGRTARAWVVSDKGARSAQPIVILQGDVTSTDGIKDNVADKKADANAPVYNVAGQRVSKSTKGLLIQNGKKFVNK